MYCVAWHSLQTPLRQLFLLQLCKLLNDVRNVQADLQAELQALYQMPRSRAVEEQKAAIRQELQALQ